MQWRVAITAGEKKSNKTTEKGTRKLKDNAMTLAENLSGLSVRNGRSAPRWSACEGGGRWWCLSKGRMQYQYGTQQRSNGLERRQAATMHPGSTPQQLGRATSNRRWPMCRAWERGWFAEIPALVVGQGKARSVSRKDEAASGKAAVPMGGW
ncbi:hypothetical protein VTJ04DRAFT_2823 [Mycothermus thermophilus]|uniref:uncharacterized protein n=1 Tax=Humicola insolens TaxID=85995 RepID=UPI003744212B